MSRPEPDGRSGSGGSSGPRQPSQSDRPARLSNAEHRKLSVQAWESLFSAQVSVIRSLRDNPVFKRLSMREYDVLYTLSKCPSGWLRLNEINRHVLLTQPSISRLVERLEARGLVQRKLVAEDRRGVLIGLTEPGKQMQRELGREHVKDIQQVVGSVLDEAELRELARITRKLDAAVRERE